jgi:hypothetical protein
VCVGGHTTGVPWQTVEPDSSLPSNRAAAEGDGMK